MIDIRLLLLLTLKLCWSLQVAVDSTVLVSDYVSLICIVLTTTSSRHVLLDVEPQSQQSFLDCVRFHINDSFNLLLAEVEAELFEHLYVEGIPIVGLLGEGVGLAVVVQVDEFWLVVLHDFSQQHAV